MDTPFKLLIAWLGEQTMHVLFIQIIEDPGYVKKKAN